MTENLFNNLIFIWIAVALIVVPFAIKIAAPYGRHTRKGWGPMIDNRLGWVIMELPALLLVLYFFFTGSAEKTDILWVFVGLWVLHYGHRSLIFPFMLRTKGKKMPSGIMISAIFFNLINGSMIGYYLGNFAHFPDSWAMDPRFISGIVIFFIGFFINFSADYTLISLRKPGEEGYKIPKGGLFNYVSCPNHFGEIIEWAGFALMTWSLPALSFFVWTAANLIPRTLNHHKWYKEKFPAYPKERKAVIPYLL